MDVFYEFLHSKPNSVKVKAPDKSVLSTNKFWCRNFLKMNELTLLKTQAGNDMEKKEYLLKVNDLCVGYMRSFYKDKAEKEKFDKSNRAQNRQTRGKYRRIPFSWIKNQLNKLKKCGIIVKATKQAMQKFRKYYESGDEDKMPSLQSIHSFSCIQ